MTKLWIQYISLLLVALLCCTCTEEELYVVEKGRLNDGDAWIQLDFGHKNYDKVVVNTRSTLGDVAESRVLDMYALIFVNDRCVYNHYFGNDEEVKKATEAEVREAVANRTNECWYVMNRTSSTNTSSDNLTDDTHGVLCMKTPSFENGELYLIANANAYTVNISPEKLGTIRTKQDLQALTATLNGEVTTRYGYFPMVAEVKNVTVTSTGISQTINGQTTNNITAELNRLDAKIDVHVKAATGNVSQYQDMDIKVKDFTPESWQIMNVPKGSFIVENEGNNDDITGYFNTQKLSFEKSLPDTYGTEATLNHSFSFYMLENRHVVPSTATGENIGNGRYTNSYHLRDLRKKNPDGTYMFELPQEEDDVKNIWEFAPENATYLILKGYLAMENSDNIEAGAHEVGADVTYYIHLGDFNSSSSYDFAALNNYSIERNTHYTYNITIKGVHSIELEVTTNNERQPGAAGNIYATQETIKMFDAHYEQFTTFVDVESFDSQTMSWYVRTPFGVEGSPKLNENLDPEDEGYDTNLSNYDYKWVWFMVNPLNANGTYNTKSQWYPGDQYRTGGTENKMLGDENHLMNVDEFVRYMKEQKRKYENGESNLFRSNGTQTGVALTIFVDENYYEQHPIDGSTSTDLWKQFVNQPNRLLHLLSGSRRSSDKESSMTQNIITIRQRSIQTPYSIKKTGLQTAWGTEAVDETEENQLWFYQNETTTNNGDQGNSSTDNGLSNTIRLLGLVTNNNFTSHTNNWKTFLEYENYNETTGPVSILNNNYKSLLYATLLRNRDNNGDKRIDAKEMKWYIASLGQLTGIFIGEHGFFNKETYLYSEEKGYLEGTFTSGNYAGYHKWRSHVISSTKNSSNKPVVVWAEEGFATSGYRDEQGWGDASKYNSPFSIRCLRNLGMHYTTESEAATAIVNAETRPVDLIDYRIEDTNGNLLTNATANSIYVFDLSNVNENSLRPIASQVELEATNEFDEMARPYKYFKTGSFCTLEIDETYNGDNHNYLDLKLGYLDAGKSPCNEGYRVPIVREGAIMNLYGSREWWNGNYTMVASYYSNGSVGPYNDMGNGKDQSSTGVIKYSWIFGYEFATMENSNVRTIREVKDIDSY